MSRMYLTPTEIKVLTLISQGFTSKVVAGKLSVSKRTIDFHLKNIYDKLTVHNRIQAIRKAIENGLMPSGDNGPAQ